MKLTQDEEDQLWVPISTVYQHLSDLFEKVEEAHFNQPKGGGLPWPEEERQQLFWGWAEDFWNGLTESYEDAPPSPVDLQVELSAIQEELQGILQRLTAIESQ